MDDNPPDWVEEGEAALFRRDAEREAAWGRFTAMRVDMLLGALNYKDRHAVLIPWTEIRRWRLRRH